MIIEDHSKRNTRSELPLLNDYILIKGDETQKPINLPMI